MCLRTDLYLVLLQVSRVSRFCAAGDLCIVPGRDRHVECSEIVSLYTVGRIIGYSIDHDALIYRDRDIITRRISAVCRAALADSHAICRCCPHFMSEHVCTCTGRDFYICFFVCTPPLHGHFIRSVSCPFGLDGVCII